MAERAAESVEPARPPALRTALWLYLAALVGTGLLVIGLGANVESVLLRFLAAVVVAGGFTAVTVWLTGASVSVLFGRPPTRAGLVLSGLAGATLWLPVSWLVIVVDGLLGLAVGPIAPPRALGTGASPAAIVIQFGLVIPLLQGVLFWGYLQRAAEQIGRVRAALLAAGLYGLFALVSTEFGSSAIPAYVLLGAVAAFAGYVTRSAWSGIAALIGFSLVRAVFENSPAQAELFRMLGAETAGDLIGGRWLLALAVCGFAAYVLLQALRAFSAPGGNMPRTGPGRFWWLPLVISVVLCLLIVYGELAGRASYRSPTPVPDTGSTLVPPVPLPPTPPG